jgi:hypothetical protein
MEELVFPPMLLCIVDGESSAFQECPYGMCDHLHQMGWSSMARLGVNKRRRRSTRKLSATVIVERQKQPQLEINNQPPTTTNQHEIFHPLFHHSGTSCIGSASRLGSKGYCHAVQAV